MRGLRRVSRLDILLTQHVERYRSLFREKPGAALLGRSPPNSHQCSANLFPQDTYLGTLCVRSTSFIRRDWLKFPRRIRTPLPLFAGERRKPEAGSKRQHCARNWRSKSGFGGKADTTGGSVSVRYWHKADIPTAPRMSALGGKAGHDVCAAKCPLMTQSGHQTLNDLCPNLYRCDASARGALPHTQRLCGFRRLRPSKAYCNAATVLLMLQHHLPCGTRHYTFILDIRLDAAGSVAEQSKRKCHLAADVCLFSTGATMSGTRFFKPHRSWEDWVSMLIGVLIGFSPWLADQQGDQAVIWNAILVGAVVLVLAQLEYVSLQRWEEIGEIIVGLWLIASPFIFGYAEAGPLRYWHFVLGAIIALLATWELWQDWRQSDKELAQHGQ